MSRSGLPPCAQSPRRRNCHSSGSLTAPKACRRLSCELGDLTAQRLVVVRLSSRVRQRKRRSEVTLRRSGPHPSCALPGPVRPSPSSFLVWLPSGSSAPPGDGSANRFFKKKKIKLSQIQHLALNLYLYCQSGGQPGHFLWETESKSINSWLVMRLFHPIPGGLTTLGPCLSGVVQQRVVGARLRLQQPPLFLDGLPPPFQHPPLPFPRRLLQLQMRSLTFPALPT